MTPRPDVDTVPSETGAQGAVAKMIVQRPAAPRKSRTDLVLAA